MDPQVPTEIPTPAQPPIPEPVAEVLPTAASTESPPINQSTNQPVNPAPIMHEIPKKRNGFVLFLIILLILVSLSSLGFWAYQKYIASPKPVAEAGTPTSEPTPTANPTANWKTYTNAKYGYSFNYPELWNDTSDPKSTTEFKIETANKEIILGTVFDGKADQTKDKPWQKNLDLSNGKNLLVSYMQCPGVGCKEGSKDITTFDQILSTFKFLGQTTSTNTTLNMTGTLQDYMKANCKSGNPQYLELQKLPVNIDTNIIKPFQTINGDTVYCSFTEDNTKPIKDGYLVIRLDNSNGINIYDDQSQELGHGGAPGLGFFGQKIFDQNGIQMGTWLQGGDGPQVLGDVGMFLRGVKKFTTKDGHLIYINYTQRAIPGSDARLMSQLKPYSSIDPNLGLNEPTVNYDQTVSAKIVDFFFGKTPSTASPEGQSMQNMKDILSAVTAK